MNDEYFLILPDYSEDDIMMYDEFKLGSKTIRGSFYIGSGLKLLHHIIKNESDEYIASIKIKTSKSIEISINRFVALLGTLKLIYPNV